MVIMCEAVFTEEPLWGCRLREGQFWGNWVSMFGFTLYRTASMWYIFLWGEGLVESCEIRVSRS